MTHYETLGVASDATADEIKSAYRRKSSECHPDKGGDGQQMAAVNRAYEVLGNAERRAQYDATGSDAAADKVDNEARDNVLSAFSFCLQQQQPCNSVEFARLKFRREIDEAAQTRLMVQRRIRNLERRRPRVVAKSGGMNLMHVLIDQQLAECHRNVELCDHVSLVLERALTLLDDYESTEVDQSAPAGAFMVHLSLSSPFTTRTL